MTTPASPDPLREALAEAFEFDFHVLLSNVDHPTVEDLTGVAMRAVTHVLAAHRSDFEAKSEGSSDLQDQIGVPARAEEGGGEADPWCREESCTWRHWRSGGMPTHRRGNDCPAPLASDQPSEGER